MKLHPLLTACAALLALIPGLATAQTTAVPGFISYQGRVLDATGANVGTGTPVNRTVIFRIWDSPSSTNTANLIYSEAQTVTVSEGEFSVLVGQGVANPTATFGYSETDRKLADLGAAFNGSARYLGVTVAATATIALTDNEITPRQQIVSTAFAMRAKVAESIGSSSDLVLTPLSGTASNYGLGWYGTGRLFGNTTVDGPVLYGNAGGALGSNASGTRNTALRWDASGRVGIGANSISSATNKLTLQGDMATTPADQLTVRGNTDNNKRLLLGYDTTANKASLQSYTAASTTGPLLLNPSGGNVGVNKADPTVALDVTGAIKASGDLTAANMSTGQVSVSGRVMANGLEFWAPGNLGALFKSGGAGVFATNSSAASGEMVLMGSPKLHLATANAGAAVMTLSGSNVGINKADPTVALDVTGAIKASGNLTAANVSTGSLAVTGLVNMGSGTGTAETPGYGLIIRHVRSTISTSGSVVAKESGNGMSVVRDGTAGGLILRISTTNNANAFVKVYNSAGTLLRSVNRAYIGSTADYVICTNAEQVTRVEVTMADAINGGHFTELVLTRFVSANGATSNWTGMMTSTTNQ